MCIHAQLLSCARLRCHSDCRQSLHTATPHPVVLQPGKHQVLPTIPHADRARTLNLGQVAVLAMRCRLPQPQALLTKLMLGQARVSAVGQVLLGYYRLPRKAEAPIQFSINPTGDEWRSKPRWAAPLSSHVHPAGGHQGLAATHSPAGQATCSSRPHHQPHSVCQDADSCCQQLNRAGCAGRGAAFPSAAHHAVCKQAPQRCRMLNVC